jgi:epoxide hydrolase-like predicted phosphatase
VAGRTGLIVDYGGVLTTDIFVSFRKFCEAEGLDPETVRDRFLNDAEARRLLEELETGRMREAEFEPAFAAVLEVESERLIDRLFGGMEPDEAMMDGVRAARAAGVRTGLLSNSWGDDRYDREQLADLFDAWVISGEVGLRKPDPAIYELAAERLGLPPEQCVFVDDLPGNLKPARAIGMGTVVHRGDAAATLAEVSELLGVDISPDPPIIRG